MNIDYAIHAACDADRLIQNLDRDLAQLIALVALISEPRTVNKLSQCWTELNHELHEVIHLMNRERHTPFPKPSEDEHKPQTWRTHYENSKRAK